MLPQIIIAEDYQSLGKKAAQMVAKQLRENPASVLGLPTGKTPLGFYRELIRLHREEGLDLSCAITFNLDEYYGLSPEDKCSFHYYMWENFFKHVNLPAENIYIPDGQAKDIEEECRRYEEAIVKVGGIDLLILGIGTNGHIGFNEPGTAWDSTTHLVRLTPETRRDNKKELNGEGDVPQLAITMGIKTIMRSDKILLVASGANKAAILARALQGQVSPEVPASVLQLHPRLVVITDKEAARFLKV